MASKLWDIQESDIHVPDTCTSHLAHPSVMTVLHKMVCLFVKISCHLWGDSSPACTYLARHVMATIMYSMHKRNMQAHDYFQIFKYPLSCLSKLVSTPIDYLIPNVKTRYFTRCKATTVNMLKPVFACTLWNYMYTAQIVYQYITTLLEYV
jgi:hypothetical protein